MKSWLASTFDALRVREFRVLWAGTWLSFVAFFMSTVVQSIVAFELTGANTAVGAVVFAQGLTMMTLSPLGGALADRWPKRRVIAVCQLLAASIFLGLSLLIAADRISVAFLALGSLGMGATFSFLGPARQALVVEVVPDRMRGNAVALSTVANTGSRVFGPALAGLLLGLPAVGASGAYAFMAALYTLAAVLLRWLPKSRTRADARETYILHDVWAGLRYLFGTPRLRVLVVPFLLVIMLGFPHVALLPGLLVNELGRDSVEVSVLFFAAALGALTASLSLARFADSPLAARLFFGMGLVFGLSLLGLAVVPSFEAACGVMLLLGAGSGGFQAIGTAMLVREAEPAMVGRVMATTMLAFAGFGLVALPLGFLADAVGERATLAAMASCICGLVVVLGLAVRRLYAAEAAASP